MSEAIRRECRQTNILFVCTGNTCRSPMAEALLKQLLKEKGRTDVAVSSAGTAAFGGDGISFYSLQALHNRGIEDFYHQSRSVDTFMLAESDMVITMTESQKEVLVPYVKQGNLFSMKDITGSDIRDPYGYSAEIYDACASQIEQAVQLIYERYLKEGSVIMRIPIASDHAAFAAKAKVIELLQAKGYEAVDMGCFSEDSVHYPEFGAKVAAAVSNGECEKGILLCGTGIGMSLVANKFPGVRAALCHNAFTAQACREHNDANILVMGARVLSEEQIAEIVNIWLDTEFAAGRHSIRLDMIKEIEKENFK